MRRDMKKTRSGSEDDRKVAGGFAADHGLEILGKSRLAGRSFYGRCKKEAGCATAFRKRTREMPVEVLVDRG